MKWHTVLVEALRAGLVLVIAAGVVTGLVDPACVDLGALQLVVPPVPVP